MRIHGIVQAVSRDPELFRDFLYLILSKAEYMEIRRRLEIMQLLLAGRLPQRKIAEKLGVGLATVERCARALKESPNAKIKTLIQKMT